MTPKTIIFSRIHKKLQGAAYCRVSTNHSKKMGSLETQKSYFEAIVQENPN